jgi:hypothetical protein
MGIFSSIEAAHSNTEVPCRMIKLKSSSRLNYEERTSVKNTFDRLQDAGLLPYWQFRT